MQELSQEWRLWISLSPNGKLNHIMRSTGCSLVWQYRLTNDWARALLEFEATIKKFAE